MNSIWAYINDIKGCKVLHVYRLKSLIELVYLKHNRTKSLTIHLDTTQKECEVFTLDNIPLPPSKTPHFLDTHLHEIAAIHLYRCSENEAFKEELELVCKNNTYLLFCDDSEHSLNAMVNKNPRYAKVNPKEEYLAEELFSVEFFKQNLALALKAHGEQKTPHGLPYAMHLLSVTAEVINALTQEPLSFDEANVAIACALLHDVNEDTKVHITKECSLGGNSEVIAKGVQALTKDKNLASKKLQMKESVARLKGRQHCVGMVKLADRITNLDVPPSHWSDAKKKEYLEEARFILDELGHTNAYLAAKLAQKIEMYPAYFEQ